MRLNPAICVLFLGLCQCPGGDGGKGVVVTPLLPAGLTASVARYRVVVELDDKAAAAGSQVVLPDKIPFTLVLPESAKGHLRVDLTAADDAAQKIAFGDATIIITDEKDYKLEIQLNRVDCGTGAWCFDAQDERSVDLSGIWGTDANDIWAVGARGTVLHFDGFAWESLGREAGAATIDLYGTWGSGEGDVWFVGALGALFRHGKGRIAVEAQESLRAIHGSGPRDIWVAGDSGVVLHFDGTAWGRTGPDVSGALNSIFALSPKDVWTVGESGIIAHYDGSSWTVDSSGVMANLYSVFGTSDGELWIAGEKGTLLRQQGTRWLPVTSGITTALYALWGESSADLFVAGEKGTILRRGGGRFAVETLATPSLYGLWGKAAPWAVGAQGTIARLDAGTWRIVHKGPLPRTSAVPGRSGGVHE